MGATRTASPVLSSDSTKTPHIVAGGPIQFAENGDNLGASSAMVQIREGLAKVIYPKQMAEVQAVYPIPKLWERG